MPVSNLNAFFCGWQLEFEMQIAAEPESQGLPCQWLIPHDKDPAN
jgi:hypothetical protein